MILLLAFIGYSRSKNATLIVETTQVTKGELVEVVAASGEVTARELANMSFPTSGKIAYMPVVDGDRVTKYQVLASLDKTLLDTAYQQALNMSRRYGATVDNIHDQLKDKDTTETYAERDTRTTAEATNDYYYNALRAAAYNLKNASLVAPFAGVVTNVLSGAVVGANVTAGVSVLTVVNPQSVYFTAEVSETEIFKVAVGQKVILSLDAYPDEEFEGEVEATSFGNYTSSTGGNVYKISVSLPENADFRFRLGMKGSANIVLKRNPEVVKIPVEALVENDEQYVWLVIGGKLEKRVVTTGVSSADEVAITDGLVEGNTIVSLPPLKAKDGQKVNVK